MSFITAEEREKLRGLGFRNAWATDAIVTPSVFDISMLDRLRILAGARLRVRVETETENPPGRVESKVDLTVSVPWWPEWRSDLSAGEDNSAEEIDDLAEEPSG